MKKIAYIIPFVLVILAAGCKKDTTISTVGPGIYEWVPSDGDAVLGPSFVTLELGQSYVDSFGAYIKDTTATDHDATTIDSVFNNTPVILPDLTTEGVKTAVYFFRNSDNQEYVAGFRNIVVYKKRSGAPAVDLSGTYKRVASSVLNKVVKVDDGVYYMTNTLTTTSLARKDVPALFYHVNDTTFDIIPQYYEQVPSSFLVDYTTSAINDRIVYMDGVNEKVNTSATPFTLSYMISTAAPLNSRLVSGMAGQALRTTTFNYAKQ